MRDIRKFGLNPDVDVKITDSRKVNRRNQFGNDYVSRVVIGGTFEELRISPSGIASSIDPGNLGYEDEAVILLDRLSAPAPATGSINTYLPPNLNKRQRIKLIARVLAIRIAHQAGHYLGNYHTDAGNATENIMDLSVPWGMGADRLLGTADDIEVRFGTGILIVDEFDPSENEPDEQGLSGGTQDSLNNTAFGLTRGSQ